MSGASNAAAIPNPNVITKFAKLSDVHVEGNLIDFGTKRICIGNGSICSVFKAKYKKKDVAVKLLRVVDDSDRRHIRAAPETWAKDFTQEMEVLAQKFHHPNVTAFFGAGVTDMGKMKIPFLLLEYVNGGSIEDYLEEKTHTEGRSWEPKRELSLAWCAQLWSALSYLHNCDAPIAHRDIKPANLLITKDHQTLKLTDFSLACPLSSKIAESEQVGTLRYMAPEITTAATFALDKTDIYGATLSCYFLVYAEKPFAEHNAEIAAVLAAQGIRPAIGPTDGELAILFAQGWSIDPKKRPSADFFATKLGALASRAHKSTGWAERLSVGLKLPSIGKGGKVSARAVEDAMDAGEDNFLQVLRQPNAAGEAGSLSGSISAQSTRSVGSKRVGKKKTEGSKSITKRDGLPRVGFGKMASF